MSSRRVWKLYEVQLRLSPPSLCSMGFFWLAVIDRWQPKQLVVQDEWHESQVILSLVWVVSWARAARSLPSSEASTCGMYHFRSGVTMLRCTMRSASPAPSRSKRAWPQGVLPSSSGVPGEAGPDVRSVATASRVPWQSMQSISIAARGSAYSLPSPWLSCSKWQSTQCMPFSRWMSLRCTAFWNFCGSSSATTAPCASSRRPVRSCLNTARKFQPWPWKSANCVRLSCGLRLDTSARNSRSDHLPRRAAPSGFARWISSRSSALRRGWRSGYRACPSTSLSHQV